MDLSVVIPSIGNWSRLKLSLNALVTQRISSDVRWEVLVVLDGLSSVDELDSPPGLPSFRYVCLATRKGRGAARNAGVAAAEGETVIFLDDDIVVGPGFVSGHLAQQRQLPSLCHGPLRELPALAWIEDATGRESEIGKDTYISRRIRAWQARVKADLDHVELCYEKHGRASRLEREGMEAYDQGRMAVAWVAFAGANLSAPRKWMREDAFDERAGVRWGLEDLSLALRWSIKGRPLTIARDAWGLHLSHSHPSWRDSQRENLCCLDFVSAKTTASILRYLEGETGPGDLEAAITSYF